MTEPLIVFQATTETSAIRVSIAGNSVDLEVVIDASHLIARLTGEQAKALAASLLVALAPEALRDVPLVHHSQAPSETY